MRGARREVASLRDAIVVVDRQTDVCVWGRRLWSGD